MTYEKTGGSKVTIQLAMTTGVAAYKDIQKSVSAGEANVIA
ncbi:hypothetical protein OHB56_12250 [Streptomyces sp. NBC_01635]|nr:hypothetical protein OHB56_12250 [Streptomyces sp. NBC_01635]